ncbi:MAG: hypothetical protein A3J27_05730 [Candidatus Tectomicrobia bacterium RIFCSPLOWO2_12_FULL_69_37]|nr:MAG: hypothetical protein A3J27_05730 [Candidatus Tectomicrobia bacterium RIFCSPLOWO2_12_FULL_69_37]OGL61308.1 MAG: hypothetical protein A3I72_16235 [Candidatus Tectomicrobia bacterium RIFCSPLOWO2_02_FULL_70_19]
MKELLALLKEVNHILREERDSTVRATKQMVGKLEGVALRCDANRRRLDMLRERVQSLANR